MFRHVILAIFALTPCIASSHSELTPQPGGVGPVDGDDQGFGWSLLAMIEGSGAVFLHGFEAVCGDSFLEGGEQCDDGNLSDGDGCSDMCQIEPGFMCTGEPSVCTATCGDGLIAPALESCDDGNEVSGDGCSDMCQIEPGFMCTGEPSVCTPK